MLDLVQLDPYPSMCPQATNTVNTLSYITGMAAGIYKSKRMVCVSQPRAGKKQFAQNPRLKADT